MTRESTDREVETIDRMVRHRSTVPAARGQFLELFVREKVMGLLSRAKGDGEDRAVLMIHGGYSPALLAFDAPGAGHSWMDHLAKAGVDVFAMDMTGYGLSSKPMMDDPGNLSLEQQQELGLRGAPRAPSYAFELVNSDSESDDIDCVVDFIRALRGVRRVTLLGWSGGGCRAGTYVVRHPEKVEKLVLFASSNYARNNPSAPQGPIPRPGVAMTIQTRAVGEQKRWLQTVKCEHTVEPETPALVWKASCDLDPVGTSWGIGGLRAPKRTYWGWNAESAQKIVVPTLVIVGEQDRLLQANMDLFEDLGAEQKTFVRIACATHFMAWESQATRLHRLSEDWIVNSTIESHATGAFAMDRDGILTPTSRPDAGLAS